MRFVLFVLTVGVYWTTASQPSDMSDPCYLLCEEFSASRRGQGDDLCTDTRQSACVPPQNDWGLYVCSHLYWSTSEDGHPGLVYSIDGQDLIGSELQNPVTCSDADRLVSGDTQNYESDRIISLSTRLFTHLSPVQRLISQPISDGDFGFVDILRMMAERHNSDQLSIHDVSDFFHFESDVYGIMDVIDSLVQSSNLGDIIQSGVFSYRQCMSCGLDTDMFEPIMLPGAPMEEVEEIIFEDMLRSVTNRSVSIITTCDVCRRPTETREIRRVIEPAQVYVMLIDPLLSGNVSYPPHLNLSTLVGHDHSGSPMFQLVAFTDDRNEIGLLINGTWFQSRLDGFVNMGHYNESSRIVSNSITAIFYQQMV